jgi:hypothetical protein
LALGDGPPLQEAMRYGSFAMDELDRFVNEENIRNFAEKLYNEHSPERQCALRQLLIQEEYRFGSYSRHLEIAERHIIESAAGSVTNKN